MVFSSLEFIFQFLPIFLLIYFLCPARYKNFCLFAGSMLFYLYGVWDTPLYLALFGASMAVNYFFGCRIARSRARFRRRKRLFWGVAYNLFWLLLFKYTGFFTENINGILRLMGLSLELPVFAPVLPVGISFYTFQAISYLADVYRKTAEYEPSFVNFAMYISMFPQLIAGPIVTYSSIKKEISRRSHSMRAVEEGLKTFTIGLGLKVLLANRLGGLWNEAGTVGYESISTPFAWLAITAFSLQIYFDFYGYSLMAKGLGRIMGFTIPENFHDPYLSLSMTEFWRRWHISLSSWFRDYVYIPLGGNRKGALCTYRNLLIVFFLTGMWHGAGTGFILWGLYHGLFLILERVWLGKKLEKLPGFVGWGYTMIVVFLGWILFRAEDFGLFCSYVKNLFVSHGGMILTSAYLDKKLLFLLIMGILFAGFVQKVYGLLREKMPGKFPENGVVTVPRIVASIAILWLCVMALVNNSYNPFIYFRF